MAFFKRHNRMAPTYESASTRQFKHGRTETIRVCCGEAKEMVHAVSDPSVNEREKALKVRAFLSAHRKLLVDATNGQGVDRHILGLRCMVNPNEQMPKVFTPADPLFSRALSFDLSTSNVSPGDLYDGLGFGLATTSGYGVNYSISRDSIRYCVTCVNDVNDTDKASKFGNMVADCLVQLRGILLNQSVNMTSKI